MSYGVWIVTHEFYVRYNPTIHPFPSRVLLHYAKVCLMFFDQIIPNLERFMKTNNTTEVNVTPTIAATASTQLNSTPNVNPVPPTPVADNWTTVSSSSADVIIPALYTSGFYNGHWYGLTTATSSFARFCLFRYHYKN